MVYIHGMKNILLFTALLLLTGCTPDRDFSNKKKEEQRKDTLNTTIDDWKPVTSSDVKVDENNEEKE